MLEPHETLIGEMPAIDKPDWISRILLCAVGFCVLMGILAATRPHPLRVKLEATEVENAGLLSRNQELRAENERLKKQLADWENPAPTTCTPAEAMPGEIQFFIVHEPERGVL